MENPNKAFENNPDGIINPAELDSFLDDITKYDKDHSEGTWLGRGMAAMLPSHIDEQIEKSEEIEGGSEEGEPNALQDRIQSNLTLQNLLDRHQEVIRKLGLDLESPNKEGDYDEKEIYSVGEIQVNLADKDKFLAFLRSVPEEQLTEAEKKILEMTVKKISWQVKKEYDLSTADDRLLELFSGLKDIIAEYERLNMGDVVAEFKEYLHYAKNGLREYIFARNHQAFEPIGTGFNLSTYQRDANPDFYLNKWEENFFEVLEKIKVNPKAQDLYDRFLKYGQDCIAFALKDEKLKKYDPEYVQKILPAIQKVKEKLDAI